MKMRKRLKKKFKKLVISCSPLVNRRFFNQIRKKEDTVPGRGTVVTKKLEGDRILVLAPHVDDELIGCGGALMHYIKNGKDVSIAFLTEGAKRSAEMGIQNMAEVREQEAREAANVIGIHQDNLYFLQGEDGNLRHSPIESKLKVVLQKVQPDTVFLPVVIDTHGDHRAVSLHLYKVLEDLLEKKECHRMTRLYMYEVQSPITHYYGNVVLDISSNMDRKRSLMLTGYPSQKDLPSFAGLMDQYNGILFGMDGAEIYLRSDINRFMSVMKENKENFEKESNSLIKLENSMKVISSYLSSKKQKHLLEKFLE